MHRSEIAQRVVAVAQLEGDFLLRSGQRSDTYFDKYRIEADPQLLAAVTQLMVPLVPDDTEVLAGLELGGVPMVTALSAATGLPAAFVRKEAKTYGTENLAEGASIEGRNVLVVEDVVTSGGQLITSVGDLRERGAKIHTAVCIIDRQQGGAEALSKDDVTLSPVFTRRELET
ncbi:MAG: orotate phosphoribosyltransferase [Acidobacteria bacterium]|nr:orotate phosphoribosyltransferase [Acidobacteriota bacterium]